MLVEGVAGMDDDPKECAVEKLELISAVELADVGLGCYGKEHQGTEVSCKSTANRTRLRIYRQTPEAGGR